MPDPNEDRNPPVPSPEAPALQSAQVKEVKAQIDVPGFKAKDVHPTTKAGINLAKYVLYILVTFLVLSIIAWFFAEIQYLSQIRTANECMKAGQSGSCNADFIKSILESYKEFHSFCLESLKVVLINLLLPVLTALLGYTFGVKESNSDKE
jgi:hypothetical protein